MVTRLNQFAKHPHFDGERVEGEDRLHKAMAHALSLEQNVVELRAEVAALNIKLQPLFDLIDKHKAENATAAE